HRAVSPDRVRATPPGPPAARPPSVDPGSGGPSRPPRVPDLPSSKPGAGPCGPRRRGSRPGPLQRANIPAPESWRSPMAELDQVNIVVRDMEAMAAFYGHLGVELRDSPPGWAPHHRNSRSG